MTATAALCGITLGMAVIATLPFAATRLLSRRELVRELRAQWRGAEYIGDTGVVRQQKFNDCGAACLKMVFATHGIERDLHHLETALDTKAQGTSLRNLRMVAQREGLRARSWKLSTADLLQAPLPAIAFINGDHFVVVRRRVGSDSLEVDDPALGRLHWPVTAFDARWSGEVLIFDGSWKPGQFRSVAQGL
jgi:ABC-type bacteriocin/lantibiotic exporter with double-glycine peptidase domain